MCCSRCRYRCLRRLRHTIPRVAVILSIVILRVVLPLAVKDPAAAAAAAAACLAWAQVGVQTATIYLQFRFYLTNQLQITDGTGTIPRG